MLGSGSSSEMIARCRYAEKVKKKAEKAIYDARDALS